MVYDVEPHILQVHQESSFYYFLPSSQIKASTLFFQICREKPVCKISTEYMGSLDNVHGLPGHCPWNQWKVWTKSMDTLDKVQGAHSEWTMSMDSVHCLPGQCQWTLWKVWTMSMDSLDKVQGAHTDWTMSMDSVDIVRG